jgi:hypothetical protein
MAPGPNAVHQLVFGDKFAGRLGQRFDNFKGAPTNRHGRPQNPKLAASKVYFTLARRINQSNAISKHINGPQCDFRASGFSWHPPWVNSFTINRSRSPIRDRASLWDD